MSRVVFRETLNSLIHSARVRLLVRILFNPVIGQHKVGDMREAVHERAGRDNRDDVAHGGHGSLHDDLGYDNKQRANDVKWSKPKP